MSISTGQRMNKREAAWHARHAALVRGDDGNLHVRHFPTANDAAVASREREWIEPAAAHLPAATQVQAVAGRRSGELRHTAFARELGITPRMVRDVFRRGGLPGAKEHSAYILMVPTHLLRLAKAYGLRQVERMAKAGLLSNPAN